jgi:quercetin dioxygenase-like cupin family protein
MVELKATRVDFNAMPHEKMRGSITRRFAHSATTMLAEVRLKAGDFVPAHRHDNEQLTYVISGAMKFILGDAGEAFEFVRAGELLIIPGGLLHAAEILEDTFELDVFNPPRADWIDGSDAYLKG